MTPIIRVIPIPKLKLVVMYTPPMSPASGLPSSPAYAQYSERMAGVIWHFHIVQKLRKHHISTFDSKTVRDTEAINTDAMVKIAEKILKPVSVA